MYSYTQCPQPFSRPPPTHTSTGDFWTLTSKSGLVSCGITAPLSLVLVHTRFCFCPPRVYFPVLCKFWQLSGGVDDNLLQRGLCHTQVCCTQRPCPCGSPLLNHTSTDDAQTQFCFRINECSYEIKRCLLLGRKVIIKLDSILKSRDITLPTKIHLVKAMVFL